MLINRKQHYPEAEDPCEEELHYYPEAVPVIHRTAGEHDSHRWQCDQHDQRPKTNEAR